MATKIEARGIQKPGNQTPGPKEKPVATQTSGASPKPAASRKPSALAGPACKSRKPNAAPIPDSKSTPGQNKPSKQKVSGRAALLDKMRDFSRSIQKGTQKHAIPIEKSVRMLLE